MNNYIPWVEKYRPKVLDDLILEDSLRKRFERFVEKKSFPNLLFHGKAGAGKTTVAKILVDSTGCDLLEIDGSKNGSVETLRSEIDPFVRSLSLFGNRKCVLIDESDYLTPKTQPALRKLLEDFYDNCSFILTCNYPDKIIEPLHSRCSVIDFTIGRNSRVKLRNELFERVENILEIEGVSYDEKEIQSLVKKYFPDYRKVLQELYSLYG